MVCTRGAEKSKERHCERTKQAEQQYVNAHAGPRLHADTYHAATKRLQLRHTGKARGKQAID